MCSLNGTKQKGRPNWPCSKVKKSIWRTIDVSELIAVHGASHSNTCGALRALAFNYTFFVSTAADDAIHSYHISIYCLFMFCYFLHFFFLRPMSQRTMSAEKLSKRILYVQAILLSVCCCYYYYYWCIPCSLFISGRNRAPYNPPSGKLGLVFACVRVSGVGLTYDAIFVWSPCVFAFNL